MLKYTMHVPGMMAMKCFSFAMFRIILNLHKYPNLHQLCKGLNISYPHAHNLVKEMKSQGMIMYSKQGRELNIYLTAAGINLREVIRNNLPKSWFK